MTAKPYQGRLDGGANVRKAYASRGDDATLSRWVKVPAAVRKYRHKPKRLWLQNYQNPAFEAGRSIFHRKGVSKVSDLKNLLVSGHSNAKIGRDVRKGLFRGYWIYTLSLEERATCPRSCAHWTDCYGNNMPYSKRVSHDDPAELMRRLYGEIQGLLSLRSPRGTKFPRQGVLLRLHALGDFFSVNYVDFWIRMLRRYDNLAIYGYTARRSDTDIGLRIRAGKLEFGRRFAIRWSDGGAAKDCTVSIRPGDEAPGSAFQCPEQRPGFTSTGEPILCATCGLCWSTDKNVAFMEH